MCVTRAHTFKGHVVNRTIVSINLSPKNRSKNDPKYRSKLLHVNYFVIFKIQSSQIILTILCFFFMHINRTFAFKERFPRLNCPLTLLDVFPSTKSH